MFHVYGVQGRVFSGTLDELRQSQRVTGVPKARGVSPVRPEADPTAPAAGEEGGAPRLGLRQHEAVQTYGQTSKMPERHALTRVADVMRRPAITVSADSTLQEAWQTLAAHGIAQAPVVDRQGALIGLIARAELLPPASPDIPDLVAERARLSQPVTSAMWSPVPSPAPDADLRRVAALLVQTGLPGVPVAGDGGQVLGFVSRTDLLRALINDPPLDLWG